MATIADSIAFCGGRPVAMISWACESCQLIVRHQSVPSPVEQSENGICQHSRDAKSREGRAEAADKDSL